LIALSADESSADLLTYLIIHGASIHIYPFILPTANMSHLTYYLLLCSAMLIYPFQLEPIGIIETDSYNLIFVAYQ